MKLQNLINILIGIVCVGLLPEAHAVVPPPDGGYPNLTTAQGTNALQSLTTGSANTAVGWRSLFANTAGDYNTAVGAGALVLNTEGNNNTATGVAALLSNTTGDENTATGAAALLHNYRGLGNTAVGFQALFSNIDNSYNTALGAQALLNSTAQGNTAVGFRALEHNTNGYTNTAFGYFALLSNTTGQNNTALGGFAGEALTTGHGNVCIGNDVWGVAGEGNTTRIRNIGSTPIVGGTTVVVAATGGFGDGKLGYASSSRRYKQEIKPMEDASESLLALKPVTFRAKGAADDTTRVKHYGLIAEEVATVNPDLVVFNPEGQPETLRFDSINAMLLNEFLKEHRKVEEQGREMQQQKAIVERQQKQIDALTADLQKVSAQIDASRPAPQVVNNP